LFETDNEVVIFAQLNKGFLDILLVQFLLGQIVIGESLTEVKNLFLSVTVKNDALKLLSDLVFLINLDLLVIYDETSEFRAVDGEEETVLLDVSDLGLDSHANGGSETVHGGLSDLGESSNLDFSVSLHLGWVSKVNDLLFQTETVELVEGNSDNLTDLVGGLSFVSGVDLDEILDSNLSGETV
jgi:hypothetical protein